MNARAALRGKLARLYGAIFQDPVFAAFYDGAGYANYGYWTDATSSGREASDALVDRLLARLPRAPSAVLDVACGPGGTTRRLADRFGAACVTAVDMAPAHVAAAARRAPGCRFAVMDAAELAFAPGTFDAVLCVEAAFHFTTRADFLAGAFRVLRPGGTLLVADVLSRFRIGRVPRENAVRDAAGYASLLRAAGFTDPRIEDVRDRSWRAFRRRYAAFAAGLGLRRGALRAAPYSAWAAWRCLLNDLAITAYLLASAVKPAGENADARLSVTGRDP